MKILFFGTPEFAANILSYLIQNQVEIAAVITKPDAPKGRSNKPVPTPVKQVALAQQIPVFQPPRVSVPEFAPTLEAFHADLFVVVAYGEIIKQHLLDMPRLGCINVHPSLLPHYRGAAPIQRCLMNGDPKTGVTIMYMVRKMDAGDMVKVVELPLGPNDAFPEVEQKLCNIGARALLDVIQALAKGPVNGIPQDDSQATLAPKVELVDCELQWSQPAQQLHNLVRAVTPEPAAWCMVKVRGEAKRLKVFATRVVTDRSGPPGAILGYGKEGLIVACGQQALKLLEVQLEGKKAVSADDLMRGIPRDLLSFI